MFLRDVVDTALRISAASSSRMPYTCESALSGIAAEVAFAAHWDSEVRSDEPMLTATRLYDLPATYANGCVVVLAEVDAGTGKVTLGSAARSTNPCSSTRPG